MISIKRFNRVSGDGVPEWALRSGRALPKISGRRGPAETSAATEGLRALAIILIGRPLAALAAFVVVALNGWWIALLPVAGLVYGSTISAVHHLIHGSLGLTPRARYFWLSTLSLIVVESGHALQVTHLAHHRTDSGAPDPEGYIENVTMRQIPLAALQFRYRLMWWGYEHAPKRRRRRVRAELVGHAVAHIAALALVPVTVIPWLYCTLIHVSSFTFALLAGKGPQTNWGRNIASPFVRVHTLLGRVLFFSHDQHLEHHVYPKVPLPRLRRLRPQLDTAFADLDIVDVRMPV